MTEPLRPHQQLFVKNTVENTKRMARKTNAELALVLLYDEYCRQAEALANVAWTTIHVASGIGHSWESLRDDD